MFEKIEQIGEGTFGQVYKARNKLDNEIVALKKVIMDNESEGLKEIVTAKAGPSNHNKGSVYMVFEFMDHDLNGLMDSPAFKFFTPEMVKCYMQQLLEGLDYCHRNNVLHRDIKGSNLLLNHKGILKLADFGLARPLSDPQKQLTNRVITLWYRPPELLLGSVHYGPEIDMWSVGCIMMELLSKKTIFPGRNPIDQLDKIFQICGTPTEENWPTVNKMPWWEVLQPKRPSKRVIRDNYASDKNFFPPEALDLIDKLLCLDPSKRITASEALDSPYFWTKPMACDPSHWKTKTGHTKVVDRMPIDILQHDDEQLKTTFEFQNLYKKPYLYLYLVHCDDVDTYKNVVKNKIKAWVTSMTERQQEWLIVYISLGQKHRISMGPLVIVHRTVYDKIKNDFNVKRDRCCQLRFFDDTNKNEDLWDDLLVKMKEGIISSAEQYLTSYEEEIRRLDAKRTLPGWSYLSFFFLKESLALIYERAHLYEDALLQYFELEVLFTENKSQFEKVTANELNDGVNVLDTSKKLYRSLIYHNNISLFDFKHYLFARQAKLLFLLQKPLEVATKAVAFITSVGHIIAKHPTAFSPMFREAWTFSVSIEIIRACQESFDRLMAQQAATPVAPGIQRPKAPTPPLSRFLGALGGVGNLVSGGSSSSSANNSPNPTPGPSKGGSLSGSQSLTAVQSAQLQAATPSWTRTPSLSSLADLERPTDRQDREILDFILSDLLFSAGQRLEEIAMMRGMLPADEITPFYRNVNLIFANVDDQKPVSIKQPMVPLFKVKLVFSAKEYKFLDPITIGVRIKSTLCSPITIENGSVNFIRTNPPSGEKLIFNLSNFTINPGDNTFEFTTIGVTIATFVNDSIWLTLGNISFGHSLRGGADKYIRIKDTDSSITLESFASGGPLLLRCVQYVGVKLCTHTDAIEKGVLSFNSPTGLTIIQPPSLNMLHRKRDGSIECRPMPLTNEKIHLANIEPEEQLEFYLPVMAIDNDPCSHQILVDLQHQKQTKETFSSSLVSTTLFISPFSIQEMVIPVNGRLFLKILLQCTASSPICISDYHLEDCDPIYHESIESRKHAFYLIKDHNDTLKDINDLQEKRQRKAAELKNKRDGEQAVYSERQRKINEMFADNQQAFSIERLKKEGRYQNPWECLEDNEDDSHSIEQKRQQQLAQSRKKISGPNDAAKKALSSPKITGGKQDMTLEVAKETFNYIKYYELMGAVERKYPKSVDIQLKYVAESLEEYFGKVEMSHDMITSLLHQKRSGIFEQKFITDTVNFLDKKPVNEMIPTIWFLIDALLLIIKQGFGLLMFLQIVFKYIKDVPLGCIDQFKAIFSSSAIQQLKPNVATFYLWLSIQSISSSQVPLSIWYSIIFPLKINAQSIKMIPSSIKELIDIFTSKVFENTDIQGGSELSGVLLSSCIEQYLWSVQKGSGKLDVKTQEAAILLFDASSMFPSKNVPHEYFSMLLSNAAIADEQERDRIISSIVECLKIDSNCFEYIKKIYIKNVAQTSNLLLYISLKWDELSLPKSSVHDLAEWCQETNNAILTSKTKKKALGKNVDINDLEMCTVTCISVAQIFKPSKLTDLLHYVKLIVEGSPNYQEIEDEIKDKGLTNIVVPLKKPNKKF
eukprot:gene15260-18066_t